MTTLESGFQKQMEHYPEMRQGQLLLSVSGGIDSMAMLHLFAEQNYSVAVMHCNFQLRGSESDEDEQFVKSTCKNLNIQLFIKRFDTKQFSEKNGISIQMAARSLRREFTEQLLKEHQFNCVCLAHHLNDSFETFLINLSRGTGVRGLTGMPVFSKPFFRPLIFATREDIINYVNKKSISYREDSSNQSDNYLRNKIRHHIAPVINSVFDGFTDRMSDNFQQISESVHLFDFLINHASNEFCSKSDNVITVDLKTIAEKGYPSSLLGEILYPFGFTRLQARTIFENKNKKETTKYISPSNIAFLKDNILEITEYKQSDHSCFIIKSPEEFLNPQLPLNITYEFKEYSDTLNLNSGPEHAWLDYSRFRFPLVLRKPATGDSFQPFGMKGKKLLSDYFTDLKLTRIQKNNIWLLCGEEHILWVCGLRTDNRVRIRQETTHILHLCVPSFKL